MELVLVYAFHVTLMSFFDVFFSEVLRSTCSSRKTWPFIHTLPVGPFGWCTSRSGSACLLGAWAPVVLRSAERPAAGCCAGLGGSPKRLTPVEVMPNPSNPRMSTTTINVY